MNFSAALLAFDLRLRRTNPLRSNKLKKIIKLNFNLGRQSHISYKHISK
jgi:hypothetical protein